jgi:hypothetical protein
MGKVCNIVAGFISLLSYGILVFLLNSDQYVQINDVTSIAAEDITNSSNHLHPWLATAIGVTFIWGVLIYIIMCGSSI